jgi:kinesin family member 11
MAGIPRPTAVAHPQKTNMRPPQARPSSSRAQSTIPPSSRVDRSGAISPAESLASVATTATGVKRKNRDYEQDGGDETNINVVVRCRGRNEREVRENSGVVLSTDGVKGKSVELSMGPSALSNKTYHFDKVFSPAADQAIIFEDVVRPILEEVIALLRQRNTVANSFADAYGLQLHNIRIRPNRYWQDLHYVW